MSEKTTAGHPIEGPCDTHPITDWGFDVTERRNYDVMGLALAGALLSVFWFMVGLLVGWQLL